MLTINNFTFNDILTNFNDTICVILHAKIVYATTIDSPGTFNIPSV